MIKKVMLVAVVALAITGSAMATIYPAPKAGLPVQANYANAMRAEVIKDTTNRACRYIDHKRFYACTYSTATHTYAVILWRPDACHYKLREYIQSGNDFLAVTTAKVIKTCNTV